MDDIKNTLKVNQVYLIHVLSAWVSCLNCVRPQFNAAQNNPVQSSTTQCNPVQSSAIQYNPVQSRTTSEVQNNSTTADFRKIVGGRGEGGIGDTFADDPYFKSSLFSDQPLSWIHNCDRQVLQIRLVLRTCTRILETTSFHSNTTCIHFLIRTHFLRTLMHDLPENKITAISCSASDENFNKHSTT